MNVKEENNNWESEMVGKKEEANEGWKWWKEKGGGGSGVEEGGVILILKCILNLLISVMYFKKCLKKGWIRKKKTKN